MLSRSCKIEIDNISPFLAQYLLLACIERSQKEVSLKVLKELSFKSNFMDNIYGVS